MPDRRRHLKFRGLIAVAAALIALAVLATALAIVSLRADAMRDAERDAGNIASVLAEQTAGSVRIIDLTLSELQDRIAAAGAATPKEFGAAFGGRDVFRILQDMLSRLSQVDVITLVDAEGRIINNSRAFPSPAVNLFDRDYFQDAMRGGRTDLLPEIVGPAVYRVAPGLDLGALPVSAPLLAAVYRLRRESVNLREISDWAGLGRERAVRMLNALYLQSGLMVSRSHPDAINESWFGGLGR